MPDSQPSPGDDADLPLQEEPGEPALAEEPGYLTMTGEAAAEDGSVVPIIGGLPAAEGSAWDVGAPADERGAELGAELPGEGADPHCDPPGGP